MRVDLAEQLAVERLVALSDDFRLRLDDLDLELELLPGLRRSTLLLRQVCRNAGPEEPASARINFEDLLLLQGMENALRALHGLVGVLLQEGLVGFPAKQGNDAVLYLHLPKQVENDLLLLQAIVFGCTLT